MPKIFILFIYNFFKFLIEFFIPINKDSEIIKCPMLNSEIFLILAI